MMASSYELAEQLAKQFTENLREAFNVPPPADDLKKLEARLLQFILGLSNIIAQRIAERAQDSE